MYIFLKNHYPPPLFEINPLPPPVRFFRVSFREKDDKFAYRCPGFHVPPKIIKFDNLNFDIFLIQLNPIQISGREG